MGEVTKFHVPEDYQPEEKHALPGEKGKLIEFRPGADTARRSQIINELIEAAQLCERVEESDPELVGTAVDLFGYIHNKLNSGEAVSMADEEALQRMLEDLRKRSA